MALEILSEHQCFGGVQGFYRHDSVACAAPMRFGVYLPPHFQPGSPVLFFLCGLDADEHTFARESGAQRFAAQFGLVLVSVDTGPRNLATLDGAEAEEWPFGPSAYYLDATEKPWTPHFRMETYLVRELRQTIEHYFSIDLERCGLFGHCMGGHAALAIALKHPNLFRSVSAFAPVASITRSSWAAGALPRLLGHDSDTWREHDATDLVSRRQFPSTIRIDVGTADRHLESQLKPHLFESACKAAGQPLDLRRHDGYDHGYYFVSTFVEAHLRHHAAALMG